MLNNVLWTEQYRPKELAEMALDEQNRRLLETYLAQGEIPHLVLEGPAGTGKTTTAKIITSKLDCTVLTLNASSERGIDAIREKVGSFARSLMVTKWNIVFLDEADALTPDAQFALRNLMESYAGRCRFILTCNHFNKIIDPIQSRCQRITLSVTPLKERFAVLVRVLETEGITAERSVIATYAQAYTDLRKMLTAAQQSILSTGTLQAAISAEVTGTTILEYVGTKRWQELVKLASTASFDALQALRSLFFAVPDSHGSAAQFRMIIGKAVDDCNRVPDAVVHFLGTCAELMTV
jgi:replication factor C small subunit